MLSCMGSVSVGPIPICEPGNPISSVLQLRFLFLITLESGRERSPPTLRVSGGDDLLHSA